MKENRNWILIRLLLFSDFGVVMSWQKNKNKWSEWMNIYKYSKNKMMKSPFRFGCAVFVWLHSNYVRIRRFLITLGSIVFILLHISAWTIHLFHMDPIHSEWQISIWRVLFLVSVSMFFHFSSSLWGRRSLACEAGPSEATHSNFQARILELWFIIWNNKAGW